MRVWRLTQSSEDLEFKRMWYCIVSEWFVFTKSAMKNTESRIFWEKKYFKLLWTNRPSLLLFENEISFCDFKFWLNTMIDILYLKLETKIWFSKNKIWNLRSFFWNRKLGSQMAKYSFWFKFKKNDRKIYPIF